MSEPSSDASSRYATRPSLMERVKGRDQQAWHNLVYIYSPLVYHVCHRWQVRDADADDVVQEVFQAGAAGIDQFVRGRAGAIPTFRTWLGGLIPNKPADFCPRRRP